MRTGIRDKVALEIVWLKGRSTPFVRSESKLQNCHARKIELVAKGLHLRGDQSKILDYDIQLTQAVDQSSGKIGPGSLYPLPVYRGLFG